VHTLVITLHSRSRQPPGFPLLTHWWGAERAADLTQETHAFSTIAMGMASQTMSMFMCLSTVAMGMASQTMSMLKVT